MKGYRYRLKPTQEQATLIDRHISCSRFVYNWGLNRKIELYQKEQKSISCFDLCKEIVGLKKTDEFSWLREVNSQSLQDAMRNLDNAFTRFFRQKKGFPNFKSKHRARWSYGNPQNTKVNFGNGVVQLQKIGKVNAVLHRKFEGKIKTCTVCKERNGAYYISVLVDEEIVQPIRKRITEKTTIGLDMGLKDFVTISTGEKVIHPKWIRNSEKRIKILQRRMSRKSKGGANRNKARLAVATKFQKVVNQRKDFVHKLSFKLANDKKINSVAIEDLNIAGMVKNHCLAKSVQDTCWNMFETCLAYKLADRGKNLIYIGRFEASSKTCTCGKINHELNLSQREWTCQSCGAFHDRDILASQNVKRFALQKQNLLYSPQELGVEPMESYSMEWALK